jgi:hypothetical protein
MIGPTHMWGEIYWQTYDNLEAHHAISSMRQDYHLNPQQYLNLSTFDCLRAHGSSRLPNLFMVTSQNTSDRLWESGKTPVLAVSLVQKLAAPRDICDRSGSTFVRSNLWACSNLATWTKEMISGWTYGWYPDNTPLFKIDYCLFNPIANSDSQKDQRKCHLQCSPLLLLSKCPIFFSRYE